MLGRAPARAAREGYWYWLPRSPVASVRQVLGGCGLVLGLALSLVGASLGLRVLIAGQGASRLLGPTLGLVDGPLGPVLVAVLGHLRSFPGFALRYGGRAVLLCMHGRAGG